MSIDLLDIPLGHVYAASGAMRMRSPRSRLPTLGAASGFLSSPEAARAPRKLAAAGTGSAWSEAFGPNPSGLIARLHQQTGGGLDEAVRAAHVRAAVWPGERGDELGGDPPRRPGPPFGRPSGVGQRRLVAELRAVEDIVRRAHRVQQANGNLRKRSAAMAQHAH